MNGQLSLDQNKSSSLPASVSKYRLRERSVAVVCQNARRKVLKGPRKISVYSKCRALQMKPPSGQRPLRWPAEKSRTFVDALEVQPHLVVRNNLRMPLAVSLLPTSHPLVPALVHPQLNPEASRSVRVKASPELALDPLNLARTALPPSLLEAAVKLVSTLVLHLVAQALPRSTTLLLTAPGIPPPRQLPRALLLPDLISVVKPLLSRHNHLSLFSPSVHRRTQILHQVLASSVNQIL